MRRGVLFHHDNVPAHTSSQAPSVIRNVGLELLHHVLYSQLLLLDSRPKLKEYTKERKFDDDGDVIDIASGWLEDQDQEFPYNVTRALEKRIRDRCISVERVCVERDQIT